jgi:thiol-disulfide isomerase/thioredoxin
MENKNIFIIGGVVLVATALFFIMSGDGGKEKEIMMKEEMMQNDKEAMMMKEKEMQNDREAMMQKDTILKDDEKMMKQEDGTMMKKKEETMMKKTEAGIYTDYTAAKLSSNMKNVLFFKASWCPNCKTTDADINKNLGNIPGNVQILKVDYDNSADLKQKYGVTYQHTFVQVDASGNMLGKWSGSNTLSALVSNIK